MKRKNKEEHTMTATPIPETNNLTSFGAANQVRDASGYTIFSSGDIGTAHAMAHRMLDEGRIQEGHTLLGAWLAGRQGSGSEWIHIQFHMAIFELELGLVSAAHDRFVEHILPAAATTSEALTDAPALAWRLWMATDSPRFFPWEPIRRTAAERIEQRDTPWIDLHHALAFAGSRDLSTLDRWFRTRELRAHTPADELLLEVAIGLRAFAAEDFVQAATALTAVVPRISEIGGSQAQNRLFHQIEAASWQQLSSGSPAFNHATAA
jgi:hypothetical protein